MHCDGCHAGFGGCLQSILIRMDPCCFSLALPAADADLKKAAHDGEEEGRGPSRQQDSGDRALSAIHDPVLLAGHQARKIGRDLRDREAEIARRPAAHQQIGRGRQHFGWNAAGVRAGATHTLVLDKDDTCSTLNRDERRNLARRPAAKDGEIRNFTHFAPIVSVLSEPLWRR